MKKILLLVTLLFSGSVFASCDLVIEGNDALQFNLKELTASASCKTVNLKFKNVGKAMQHNWALTNTSELMTVGMKGSAAGLAKDYIDPNAGSVFAYTPVINPGTETSISIDMTKLKVGGEYSFLCSVPGHFVVMKGKFIVRP